MQVFTPKQLNFFKFATIVTDEFPVALRTAFVCLWNHYNFPWIWDDSPEVLSAFVCYENLNKVPVPNIPLEKWDCTVLFSATLFAQTFAEPRPDGTVVTLYDKYAKPKNLGFGKFHSCVSHPSRDRWEIFVLALDQLRILRNVSSHALSTKSVNKETFDCYIGLAKDAFQALGHSTAVIDAIGSLAEEDFPTSRQKQLEDELKRVYDLKGQLNNVETEVKGVTFEVSNVKTQITDVGSELTDVKTQLSDIRNGVENVLELTKEFVPMKKESQKESPNGKHRYQGRVYV